MTRPTNTQLELKVIQDLHKTFGNDFLYWPKEFLREVIEKKIKELDNR